MTRVFRTFGRQVGAAAAAAALLTAVPTAALAQDDPNTGALTFTGGLDVPSVYIFRGILQEGEPKVTLWPYGDLGISLMSGDGGLKSVAVNFGVWNSLQTGNSGTDGPSGRLHYEEDFYATLNLGFGGGLGVGLGYMALTSPNNMFNTVKEFQLKVTKAHMLNPYGFVAMELSADGSADGLNSLGNKGTYLELGVGPSWALGARKATLAIPVKVGLSLKDYYELAPGNDSTLGFFDIGGLVTLPLSGMPSRYGAWNVHGGIDYLRFGDNTEQMRLNVDGEGGKNKIVWMFGIGVSY